MTNVMVKTCLNQKIIKNSNLIQAMKNSVCPKAKVIRRPNFTESRICPNIYRMFRSVDRRHDMIIAWRDTYSIFQKTEYLSEYLPNVPKCGLNTRHDYREVALTHLAKRKLCALTNAPPVQYTTGQLQRMLTILPKCTFGYWTRSVLQWALKDLMMTNVMVKTCLNQKIIKNSNLIQAMKNSVCPKAKVIRRPNFTESRICPNIYRMFRSVDRRHDIRKPNLSEYLPNVPKCGLNTRHDNREVKWSDTYSIFQKTEYLSEYLPNVPKCG